MDLWSFDASDQYETRDANITIEHICMDCDRPSENQ